MYFDFEDYRPDITPVGQRDLVARRVLLSIIVHLLRDHPRCSLRRSCFPLTSTRRARALARAASSGAGASRRGSCSCSRASSDRRRSRRRRAEASDQDRMARSRERAEQPTNPLPFSRGNTPERVEELRSARRRAAAGPSPIRRPASRRERSAAGRRPAPKLPESPSALQLPTASRRRRRAAPAADRPTAGRIARRRAAQPAALRPERSVRQPAGRRRPVRPGDSVRHQGRRVRAVDPPVRRAGEAQLAHSLRGDVDEGARRHHVQRAQGRLDHRSHGRRPVADRRVQQRRVRRAGGARTRRSRCRPSIPPTRRSSPSRSSTTKHRPR